MSTCDKCGEHSAPKSVSFDLATGGEDKKYQFCEACHRQLSWIALGVVIGFIQKDEKEDEE